jgi:DNA-binding NarL/FixJ family response regulator
MGLTISSALSTASVAAANSPSTSQAARTPQPTTNNTGGDTVRLSESQQVYQLYNQGQQISQIATTLSLPVETVNNYLGISASTG